MPTVDDEVSTFVTAPNQRSFSLPETAATLCHIRGSIDRLPPKSLRLLLTQFPICQERWVNSNYKVGGSGLIRFTLQTTSCEACCFSFFFFFFAKICTCSSSIRQEKELSVYLIGIRSLSYVVKGKMRNLKVLSLYSLSFNLN